MNRSQRMTNANRAARENKENENQKRREMSEMVKKIEMLNALENENEDALFNAIELRENVTKDAQKVLAEKLERDFQLLLDADIPVETEPVPVEMCRGIEELIKASQRKAKDTTKMKKKIEEVVAKKTELNSYIDSKLDAISRMLKEGD